MTKQDEIQQNHLLILLNHYKEENKQALAHLSIRYGKTKLSCALLRGLFSYDQTTLIAYPDNKIREVWESECLKWGYSNPNITYVNFSSLWKYEDKVFDMVVCDEVHELSENQLDILHIIITNDRNIKFLGLSGTISKETQQRIGIPIVVEYSTSSGKEDKILADYRMFLEEKYHQLALAAIGKTGVTYPNLDCVILLNFTYNAEESSQVLFRSLKLDYKEKCADLHLITLNEPPEIKKVKESLSMLDKTKITYL